MYGYGEVGSLRWLIVAGKGVTGVGAFELSCGQITNEGGDLFEN